VSSDSFVKRSILWKSSGCFQSFQSLLVRARGDISAGEQASFRLKPGRYGWAKVARGSAMLNGTLLGGLLRLVKHLIDGRSSRSTRAEVMPDRINFKEHDPKPYKYGKTQARPPGQCAMVCLDFATNFQG
jgi:hypothetical protein